MFVLVLVLVFMFVLMFVFVRVLLNKCDFSPLFEFVFTRTLQVYYNVVHIYPLLPDLQGLPSRAFVTDLVTQ